MSTPTIFAIQQNVARYGLSTLVVLGNIGNLLTMFIFTRKLQQRLNSCMLYLLCASISNWIVINTALICNIYGVDHIDPQHLSNVVCKLRWYGTHALLMISRSFMIAGCIDRWALCSQNVTIRAFSQPRIARRVIVIILLIWAIIPIHLGIFFNNSSGRCTATPDYAFPYAIYSLIVIGIVPLFLMILFSVLAWRSLKLSRERVAPVGYNVRTIAIHKRDRNLMRMLAGEVFVYFVTTLPYPALGIYNAVTSSIAAQKSSLRLAIESLIGYIITPLLNFTYCCAQFYVYAFCSRKFRHEFIRLLRRQPIQNITITAPSHSRIHLRHN